MIVALSKYINIVVKGADWSETKIYDLVLFRRILENSMTQLARVTEVTDCMYVNSCALSRVR